MGSGVSIGCLKLQEYHKLQERSGLIAESELSDIAPTSTTLLSDGDRDVTLLSDGESGVLILPRMQTYKKTLTFPPVQNKRLSPDVLSLFLQSIECCCTNFPVNKLETSCTCVSGHEKQVVEPQPVEVTGTRRGPSPCTLWYEGVGLCF